MKSIILLSLLVLPSILLGQVPTAGNLVNIHDVSTVERNSIRGMEDGMLIYDKDEQALYTYSSIDGWQKMQTAPNVYVGSFIISAAGAQSITGLPFKPSQITFTAQPNIGAFNIDDDSGIGNNVRGLKNTHGTMSGFARDDNGITTQQVIFSAGHGNSINDISRYASNASCIGIRFSHQNGDDTGKILARVSSFDTNGFTISSTYINGTLNLPTNNPITSIEPDDVQGESILVLYTAYR